MEQAKLREKVYEKLWIIPDWNRIQQSEEALLSQSLEFKTGKSFGAQTKWKIGFKFGNSNTNFYLCWTLIETEGFPENCVRASTKRWILQGGAPVHLIETPISIHKICQDVNATKGTLSFNSERWISESWVNSNGEVTFKLMLTIMEPDVLSTDLKTELFHNASYTQARTNFASLLKDQSTADLKIISSDEKELFAHKTILKAQCPVFELMFRSDLSENQTGIVNVKDVNAKTMGIFLHFFYTGELLPSWKDDDTVVGFTYAVGKYHLVNVLEFLNEVLGSRCEEDSFKRDIQLLDLARKLNLKTAEKELLARIKTTMNKVNSGDELFDLYPW